ncbi:alpha/beta hydrolase [Streptomyces sp. RK9]|uniref:alpha/beta hydrolase n=1 Tax=Streptomyces sp. RK9 TaxID=3239284 RepID=UPI003864874E
MWRRCGRATGRCRSRSRPTRRSRRLRCATTAWSGCPCGSTGHRGPVRRRRSRDEGLAYADTLAAAGVPVRRHRYPGLIHGFISYDTRSRVVDAAVTEMYAELGALLRPSR